MGGALGSAVTGCDIVNGGGKASDGGEPKVFSLRGIGPRGNRHRTLLCPDRCDRSYWQKAPRSLEQQFRFACVAEPETSK